jgi:phosphatidylethanolamine-binding protein (PEBP) family uncharacterized protein
MTSNLGNMSRKRVGYSISKQFHGTTAESVLAAQQAPTLRFAVPDTSKSYVVIGLDLDPPFPSFSFLGPALHWVQSGYKVTPGSTILTTNAPFVSNYIGPAPPLGGAPHRYTFFLYEEPGRFDPEAHAPPNGTTMGIWKRLRISLDDLEKRLKLGLVIAANYFTSI